MAQKKNSETGGVLPTERQTVHATIEGSSKYLIYRKINYSVLAGVANSMTNLDGSSFCHKYLLEGMRQICTAV